MSMLINPYAFGGSGGGGGGGSDYETVVLADSPQAFYLFDEASGSTAADSSGNGRDATISGSPTYNQTGPDGFAGGTLGLQSGDKVTTPDLSGLGVVGAEFWFSNDVDLHDAMTNQLPMRTPNSASETQGVVFGPFTSQISGEVVSTLRNDPASSDFSGRCMRAAQATIKTGWRHLVIQWSGTEWEIWVDAIRRDNANFDFGGAAQANFDWNEVVLGDSGSDPFTGLMGGVAFYDTVLTKARIQAHWETGAAFADPGVGSWVTEVGADTPTMWLRLGESSGTTATDEQGNHDGTYSGVVLGATGLVNDGDTAAEWDDTSDYVQVADHADFETNTFTFECWVVNDTPAADVFRALADKTAGSSSNNSWGIYWENRSSQGSPQRLYFISNGVSVEWMVASYEIGTAGHLVVVKDGSEGRIYWNGHLVVADGVGTNNANGFPMRIGQLANSTSTGWDGIIDEVLWYSGAVLSDARIKAHYFAGSA